MHSMSYCNADQFTLHLLYLVRSQCELHLLLIFCRHWKTLNFSKFLGKELLVRWSCVERRVPVICMPSRFSRNQSSLLRLAYVIFFFLFLC